MRTQSETSKKLLKEKGAVTDPAKLQDCFEHSIPLSQSERELIEDMLGFVKKKSKFTEMVAPMVANTTWSNLVGTASKVCPYKLLHNIAQPSNKLTNNSTNKTS